LPILTAHSAVGTVLPTEIGDFNHSADENLLAELCPGDGQCLTVELFLRRRFAGEIFGAGKVSAGTHHFVQFTVSPAPAIESC
jgi:hypothetical protein